MKLYQSIEKYYISERCKGSYISDSDMGFICGLLKDVRPKKILELGVAKGGSTVDLLNCIKELEIDCEMYSVDLAERYFVDESLTTGYLADEYKKDKPEFGFHKMILGKNIAQCLDEIGGDIDFVFMDTTHRMPGEVLDFLVIYPYLSSNAVIVLDDLKLHFYQDNSAIACTTLFTTVTAEKFLNTEDEYPNVGAFRITEDTGKYLLDVFNALLLPWFYIPCREYLESYDNIFFRYYNREELKIWSYVKDMAIYYDMVKKNKLNIYDGTVDQLPFAFENTDLMIYGAGKRASALYKLLSENNVLVSGFVVSDGHKKVNSYMGVPVYEFKDIKNSAKESLIIQAVLAEVVSIKLALSGCRYLMLAEPVWKQIECENSDIK